MGEIKDLTKQRNCNIRVIGHIVNKAYSKNYQHIADYYWQKYLANSHPSMGVIQ